MKLAPSFFNLLAAVAVVTSPLLVTAKAEGNALEKRAIWSTCDSWGSYTSGGFTVYQNLWGASTGTGSQCINLNSVSGNTFAWDTTWSWSGGSRHVKSYDNVAYNIQTGVQISKITSIPSTWTWSQTSSNVSNVAYDLMLNASSDINQSHAYEIMIWLGAFGGARPISTSGSPVATPTISGRSWKLYDGYNGSTRVFSFVASSIVTSYSGDLLDFLKYLATNNGFPTSQYLVVLQAGTEPFTGSNVKLTTTSYTVALNTGSSTGTTTTSRTTSTSRTTTASSLGATAAAWGQCGGSGWTGPTVCATGSTCTYSNAWYSQCIPS